MKITMKISRVLCSIGFCFLVACQDAYYVQDAYSESGDDELDVWESSAATMEAYETKEASNESLIYEIPYTRERPPSGVLDQLAWWGTGGTEGMAPYRATSNCRGCDISVDDNTISFSGFESNQKIVVSIYEYNRSPDACGRTTASHVSTFWFQINSYGSEVIYLTGNTSISLLVGGVYDYNSGSTLIKPNVSLDYEDCN
jgi:hypothetical protein